MPGFRVQSVRSVCLVCAKSAYPECMATQLQACGRGVQRDCASSCSASAERPALDALPIWQHDARIARSCWHDPWQEGPQGAHFELALLPRYRAIHAARAHARIKHKPMFVVNIVAVIFIVIIINMAVVVVIVIDMLAMVIFAGIAGRCPSW